MVRKAQIEDINSINELGKLVNSKFVKLFNIEEILKEDISVIYVYEKANKVIGFLHATMLYETCDIINVVVDLNNRSQGVASNLIDTLITELDESVQLINLEVSTENLVAINLYKKFGFEIINERLNYYGTENAYLMGKKIIYEK